MPPHFDIAGASGNGVSTLAGTVADHIAAIHLDGEFLLGDGQTGRAMKRALQSFPFPSCPSMAPIQQSYLRITFPVSGTRIDRLSNLFAAQTGHFGTFGETWGTNGRKWGVTFSAFLGIFFVILGRGARTLKQHAYLGREPER